LSKKNYNKNGTFQYSISADPLQYLLRQKLPSEAASGGVLQIICSSAAKKLKLNMMPGS